MMTSNEIHMRPAYTLFRSKCFQRKIVRTPTATTRGECPNCYCSLSLFATLSLLCIAYKIEVIHLLSSSTGNYSHFDLTALYAIIISLFYLGAAFNRMDL